jgi:hypothetical protein
MRTINVPLADEQVYAGSPVIVVNGDNVLVHHLHLAFDEDAPNPGRVAGHIVGRVHGHDEDGDCTVTCAVVEVTDVQGALERDPNMKAIETLLLAEDEHSVPFAERFSAVYYDFAVDGEEVNQDMGAQLAVEGEIIGVRLRVAAPNVIPAVYTDEEIAAAKELALAEPRAFEDDAEIDYRQSLPEREPEQEITFLHFDMPALEDQELYNQTAILLLRRPVQAVFGTTTTLMYALNN